MAVRSIPAGLAQLLQLLELEQPRVLTAAQVGGLAQEAGLQTPTDVVVRRLRERGWLLPLATKGVWEFAPADRAGAFGSGDPLIELRAVLARDSDAPYVVAAESAAYMLGYASRRPDPECVSAPHGVRPPKALSALRLVRWEPATLAVIRDDLPCWAPSTLVAFMATRPASYHDWPNVGEWLRQAVAEIRPGELALELAGRSAGSWARAAYLLDRGGAAQNARVLAARAPAASGPFYLGDRESPGRYDRTYDVIDSTGLEVGDA
ncbi:MAG: type IV toxin-antitoxin system AbiEi family antitoxin domain-containing protein [Coriobacteriales bacterium]|nr:type IV toxin-antitoxin system AbiEi family antitoxin domain-containing protein [Coriobacteriales bacterium]